MTPAYIALGSNLLNPAQQLRNAVTALEQLPSSRLDRVSSVYRSPAIGPGRQPDYLNAVARLLTTLAPLELLHALQQIEQEQGRVRDIRWGPRTLDLDLLLYGETEIDTLQLSIPHPRMHERDFVLYPLREISDTDLVLPNGWRLEALIGQHPETGLVKTNDRLQSNQATLKR